MARCNTNENINEDGNYEIHVNEDVENVSARIQSRQVSSKKIPLLDSIRRRSGAGVVL